MTRVRVARCPFCGELMAFYAHYKTKSCTRCGKTFNVSECKQYGIFENAFKASEFVKKLKLSEKYGGQGK